MKTEPAPTFYWVVVPPGCIALVLAGRRPWPHHMGITRELVRLADPDYLNSGDGFVRFHPDAGAGALYGFAHPDPSDTFDHYDLLRVDRP